MRRCPRRGKRRVCRGGKKRRQRGGTLLLRHVLEGVVTDPKAVVSERVRDVTFQFKAGEFSEQPLYFAKDGRLR